MNLTKSKILLVITIGLAIIVLLSLYILSREVVPPTDQEVEEESSVEKMLLFDSSTNEVIDPKLAIFDNLIVGKSTDNEIKKISGLKSEQKSNDGAEYSFPSPLSNRDNLAITKNGTLVYKRFITMKDVDHWEAPSMIAYKEKYGDPEMEKKGSIYYGHFEVLYLWATKGIAIIGNDFTDEVKEVHVFVPTTTDEYLRSWGKDSTEFKEETPEDHQEEVAL